MEYTECPICHNQNFMTILENVEMGYAIKQCFKCGTRRMSRAQEYYEKGLSYNEVYQQGRADQKAEDNEFFNFEGAWELEKQKIKTDAIDEFIDWLRSRLATIHLFPDQRAKLYADILAKAREFKEQK